MEVASVKSSGTAGVCSLIRTERGAHSASQGKAGPGSRGAGWGPPRVHVLQTRGGAAHTRPSLGQALAGWSPGTSVFAAPSLSDSRTCALPAPLQALDPHCAPRPSRGGTAVPGSRGSKPSRTHGIEATRRGGGVAGATPTSCLPRLLLPFPSSRETRCLPQRRQRAEKLHTESKPPPGRTHTHTHTNWKTGLPLGPGKCL